MGNERPLTTPFDRAVALVVAISLEGSTLGVAAMAWERPKPRDPNIEKRRLAAVAKMRKETGADPKKVAVLHERTEKIEQKHLPSRLYGLAQTEAQLRKALAEASRPALSPQAKRAAWTKVKAEAAAVTAGAAKVEKILSTSKSPHAAAFLAKLKVAKHLAAAVAVRPGKPEQMDKAVAELSSLLAKVRAPPKKPFGHAPKSRQLTPVTPRVRQASLDDLHLMHPRYASVGAMFHVATTLSELAEGALAPPTPQDLLATPEAPITPAITALAASLQNDPVQIYKYVRNTIVPEPYFGSKKGALGALAEGTGNDYDQASLLVSLLRACNIPARYETGQVLLSPRQAMDFTNTDDPTAAVTVMDTIGMLATANLDQNNNIDSVALDQHAWVRAYVPYTNYRGSNAPGSRSIWVRLDPSVKVVDREPPAFAIGTNVTFNFANYLSGTTPMSTVSSPLTVFETQLASYLQANPSLQCDNLDQLRPTNAPVALDLHLLPSELGTQLVQSESVSDALDPATDYSFSVDVDGTNSPAQSLPAAYGQLFALRYVGATTADQQAITQAGSISKVSPESVNVVPALKVGGVVVWEGAVVSPGTPQTLTVTMNVPGLPQAIAVHDIVAGSIYGLGLADSHPTDTQLAAVKALAPAAVAAGAPSDDVDEARAEAVIFSYLHHIDRDEKKIFGYAGDVGVKDVTEGIAGHVLTGSTFLGIPVTVGFGDWQIDVQREADTPFAQNNDNSQLEPVNEMAGFQGSHWENRVFQEIFNSPAVSTTNGLQIAASQGIALLTLTTPSQMSELSGYSADSTNEIAGALGQGEMAIVPAHPYNYAASGLTGLETYLLLDPVAGTGEYREGSSLNGAEMLLEALLEDLAFSTPDDSAPCACTGSEVNQADGNYFFSRTDLTLPAVGIPISFSRTYDTLGNVAGTLGANWMHSYERKLSPNANGSVTFVTSEGQEIQSLTFASSSGTYTSPPGWNLTLTGDTTAGWTLTHKDGHFSTYAPNGLLLTDQDTNGNVVTLTRNSDSTVGTVIDTTGRTALSFGYTSGQLTSVTDASGRTISFAQIDGNLVSATDVIGQTETYAYGNQGQLVGRTDKNGNTWFIGYDANGRWDQETDPQGNVESASYDNQGQSTVYTDKNGNPTLTAYNNTGNPTSVTDASGNTKTMTWDANADKLTDTDGRGNTTKYTYSAIGNLTQRVDPDQGSFSWSYGAFSRPTAVTTPDGTTNNAYDSHGNLLTSTDPFEETTTYSYMTTGQLSTVLAPSNTAATTFAYNADGTTKTLTDPMGAQTTFGYDGAGHLTQLTDPLGHTRTMAVDARGQVQSTTDALQNTSSFSYDANGNRTSLTDPTGAKTGFAFDSNNRLTTTTDAQGNQSSTGYDPNGNALVRTDANGNQISYAYDASNRLIQSTDALGNVNSSGFCSDLSASPCQQVDPNGNVTTKTFDTMGRATTVTNGAGDITSTTYSTTGNVTLTTDPLGNLTTYVYLSGRVQSITDAVGGAQSFTYDARGNRASLTYSGALTKYTYDANNRLLTETNPLGQVTTYTYNSDGTRATKLDANGHLATYSYDANKRLTGVVFADGSSYVFQFDSRGHRILEQSAAELRTLVYDSLGRLQTATDANLNKTLAYGYDAAGNRISLAFDGVTVGYAYDADNRLTTYTDPDGELTNLTYDPGGRRTSLVQGNGVATAYAYDQANRTLSIQSPIQSFGYTYDLGGNPLTKTFTDSTSEGYVYDGDNRLTNVTLRNNATATYTYNARGDRNVLDTYNNAGAETLSQDLSYNAFDQVTGTAGTPNPSLAYTFDNNGNRLSFSSTNTSTNVVTTTRYTWNDDDRLATAVLPNAQVDTFLYDANGIRVGKSDSTGSVRYLIDPLTKAILATYDAGTFLRLFTYNQNPQKLDEVFTFKTAQGIKYYPHTDMLGSVTALSDSTATSQASWTYDVYGTRTQTSGTLSYAFGYTGREHDVDTGLIYSRQRYYDPSVGSWLSPDRLIHPGLRGRWFPPGGNAYQYASSSPTIRIDPSGLFDFGVEEEVVEEVIEVVEEVIEVSSPGILFAVGGVGLAFGVGFLVGYLIDEWVFSSPGIQSSTPSQAGPQNGGPFSPNQSALVNLAQWAQQVGIDEDEADILLEWAEEYDIPYRNDIGTDHWVGGNHIHIGPVNHIPVECP